MCMWQLGSISFFPWIYPLVDDENENVSQQKMKKQKKVQVHVDSCSILILRDNDPADFASYEWLHPARCDHKMVNAVFLLLILCAAVATTHAAEVNQQAVLSVSEPRAPKFAASFEVRRRCRMLYR